MSRARSLALVLGMAALGGAFAAAHAAIPAPSKIERAIATANRASGRTGPLLLDIRLQIAGGGATATGVIATHPTGLARLELQTGMGFTERHLLRGTEYRASRDGKPIDDPHPFLPPLFLLQAGSGEALSAALTSLGMTPEVIVLGRLGDRDCYVLGGRNPRGDNGEETLRPSLWVDMQTFEPVRFVGADGTEYRLTDVSSFKGIRLPRFIEIDPPGPLRARLEVVGATQADAPAAAFQPGWLEGSAGASVDSH